MFCSDVQLHLIAYGGENQWPSHVTVGGKLQFKGKAPSLKFTSAPNENYENQRLYTPFRHYIAILEDLLYDLKLAIGQDLTARTFTEAYYYPFRTNALKSILVVNSKPCEVGKFFLVSKNFVIILGQKMMRLSPNLSPGNGSFHFFLFQYTL